MLCSHLCTTVDHRVDEIPHHAIDITTAAHNGLHDCTDVLELPESDMLNFKVVPDCRTNPGII